MFETSLAVSAFIAGLLTFLAPCTLPLVPGYLGFISGVDQKDLYDPTKERHVRRTIFLNGVFFILGFAVVFILFGTLAGLAGQLLAQYRVWLSRIGGIFVIFFGLFMLGFFQIGALKAERRMKMPMWLTLGKPSSSFIVGATFAFGWTPCVGPILGSILLLASSSATALQGAWLLTVFSLGLAVPFLIISFAYSRATKAIQKISGALKWISIIGGIFLVVLGLLLITDKFGLTIQYGFMFMEFLGLGEYEQFLLEFL